MRTKVLLSTAIIFIVGIVAYGMSMNLVSNGEYTHWGNGTSFITLHSGQKTVDGWSTNQDGDSLFSIFKVEHPSGNSYVKIAVAEKKSTHIIDFYQLIEERDSYLGKQLTFSVKVRADRPGICQAIINDDSGTAASAYNKSSGWETLTVTKTVNSGRLTYLNAAVRIKADDSVSVDIDDSRVYLWVFSIFNSLVREPIHAVGLKYITGFADINRSTGFAFDILLCMVLLGIWLRIASPKNPFSYQLTLSTIGLLLTLFLWANSWGDYVIVYSLWFLLVFVLRHIFRKWISVVILSGVYIVSIYYFRSEFGNPWDTLLYVGTLQLQYMRGIDIVTTDVDHNKSFRDKILNFISYIGVPVNVNAYYYVRYRDWVEHVDSFRSIARIRDNYATLLKRFSYVILSLFVLLYLQGHISSLIFKYISNSMVMNKLLSVIFALLAFWPLMNNLLFIGSNLIGIPGIELSNMPILTASPIDYWRRQQLGVATFFRENIYENTWGGVKRSRYRNLLYTFTFVGFWHGLTFQWAIWGLMWGGLLIANRYYRQNYRGGVVRLFERIRVPYVYGIVCWIFTMLTLVVFQMIVNMNPLLGF